MTRLLFQCSRVELLRTYASLLQAKLPTAQAGTGQQYRLLDGEEVFVCHVVNTAEYCADILPQLEDMIKCVQPVASTPSQSRAAPDFPPPPPLTVLELITSSGNVQAEPEF